MVQVNHRGEGVGVIENWIVGRLVGPMVSNVD